MSFLKDIHWMLLFFAGVMFISCDKDDENILELEYSPIEDAIYIGISDNKQPQWLQSMIAENPYVKILYSKKDGGTYLVQNPQRGSVVGYRAYKEDGKQLSGMTEEQQLNLIQSGIPWTCTHIYSFPLYPGDEEWNLERYTSSEIKAKLIIPVDLLMTMTTADLLEVCLDYAYSSDFLFYDDLQKGIDYLRKQFNGYNELFGREDLPEVMLRKYDMKMRTADVIGQRDTLTIGGFGFHFILFKMLLAQEEILSRCSHNQLRLLIQQSEKCTSLINEKRDIFGSIHYISILYLYSRIIVRQGRFSYANGEEKEKLEYFAKTCTMDPSNLSLFTEDFQWRMINYLDGL